MGFTRRDFIQRVGALGGLEAATAAMSALGLSAPAYAAPAPLDLPPGSGTGVRIVILGAGMAGMSAANELGKAGYRCTILEARDRVGGRNWTIRRGAKLAMIDGTEQLCGFDEDLYFNAGPARLPSHHQAVLGYCREFGVALEVEVNSSRGSLLWNRKANGGKPLEQRQVLNDTRGHVAELLTKAIHQGALDQDLTKDDRERMVVFLRQYGDLKPNDRYGGSTRAGYAALPGPGPATGSARDPVSLDTLLDLDLWPAALFEDVFDMQATMFQPVGGMDRVPMAFAKRLGPVIRLGHEVAEIRRHGAGVRVAYLDKKTGARGAVEADYCLCTIPLPALAKIPADFQPAYADAIRTAPYGNAVKVAWQSRRFWETEQHIYGGLSWVKGPTNTVWYPSAGFFRPKGIILGAYTAGPDADAFAALPLAAQLQATRDAVEGLHPGRSGELEHPMAIAWSKVPYTYGIAARWLENDARYTLLGAPDGPFYFAGEHLSHIGAWQEGAILAGRRAIGMIAARVAAQRR